MGCGDCNYSWRELPTRVISAIDDLAKKPKESQAIGCLSIVMVFNHAVFCQQFCFVSFGFVLWCLAFLFSCEASQQRRKPSSSLADCLSSTSFMQLHSVFNRNWHGLNRSNTSSTNLTIARIDTRQVLSLRKNFLKTVASCILVSFIIDRSLLSLLLDGCILLSSPRKERQTWFYC